MLLCGPNSSSVKALSLFSETVEPQTQLETAAHLSRLLFSLVQVEDKLCYVMLCYNMLCYLNFVQCALLSLYRV